MLRRMRACIVLVLASPLLAAPPTTSDWPYDVLRLKNGVVHKGLLLEENGDGVRFQIIGRAPGRPTVLWPVSFAKKEVAKVEKLPEDQRAVLQAKLKEIDESPQAWAKRLDKLDLKVVDWQGNAGTGLRYSSDYFTLVSDAPEEVVRRAAYRLENVYAAYARFLRPRFAGGPPTVIHVHQSLAGYQKAAPNGEPLRNPAFYEPTANRIVCGTDLQKLGDDLARFHQDGQQQLDDLAKQEAKVIELYGKKPDLARHLQPFKEMRTRIKQLAQSNDEAFDRTTRQLFQTLYHESFHAYVGNFVYPPVGKERPTTPGDLPRWLNEGMAQVFETAVFEAGELRLGHADRTRLEKAKDCLSGKQFPALKDIVTAGREVFVVTHDGKRPEADRAYVATWALASYLMFDRRVLGSEALDEFVKASHAGGDVVASFEKLVGQSLPDFEKPFHDWLRRLQPNGSLLQVGK